MGPFLPEQPWGGIRALRVPGTLALLGSWRFSSLRVQTGASGLLSLHSSPAARVRSQHLGLSPLSPALPKVEGRRVTNRRPPLSLQAETGPGVQLSANPPRAAPAGTHHPQPPGLGFQEVRGPEAQCDPTAVTLPRVTGQARTSRRAHPGAAPTRVGLEAALAGTDPSDPHAHPGGHSALTGSGRAPSRTSRPPWSELSSPRSDPRSSKNLQAGAEHSVA